MHWVMSAARRYASGYTSGLHGGATAGFERSKNSFPTASNEPSPTVVELYGRNCFGHGQTLALMALGSDYATIVIAASAQDCAFLNPLITRPILVSTLGEHAGMYFRA